MIKKNSWIVALILALSLTVFFGCVDGFVPVADEDTYTEFVLKDFNTWGNGGEQQTGWANDNSVWGDPDHTAKAIGLELEEMKKARYLEIDLSAELAGSMTFILGGDSKGWTQNDDVLKAGASGTQKIDLTLLKGYSDFVGAKEKARIIIQYYQAAQGNVPGIVKEARLLISDKTPEAPAGTVLPDVAGAGKDGLYKVPKYDLRNQFLFMDLNNVVYSDLNPSDDAGVWNLPKAEVKAGAEATDSGSLVIEYNSNTQAIFITFTDSQKAFLQDAAKGGYKFKVDLDAEVDGTNNKNTRWGFATGGTANWDVTNLIAGDYDATSKPSGTGVFMTGDLTPNLGRIENLNGFVLQNRTASALKVTIKSIKVTLIDPTVIAKSGTRPFNLVIRAPVAGTSILTSVGGTGFSGAITWSPNPINGKYGTNVAYTATIVLSASAGYVFPYFTAADFEVNCTGHSGACNGTAIDFYNPITKTIITKPFATTDATPAPLPSFKLSTDEGFQAKDAGPFTIAELDGFAAAGSPVIEIVKLNGKNVINVTSKASWGDGIDITDAYFNFDAGDKITVVVCLIDNNGKTGTEFLINAASNGWKPVGANPTITKDVEVKLERTLAAGDFTDASYTGLRLRINANPGADMVDQVWQIREIDIVRKE